MAKTHLLKFAVTRIQRERIEEEARLRGYLTLASYLRDITLKNTTLERKVAETNERVRKVLQLLEK